MKNIENMTKDELIRKICELEGENRALKDCVKLIQSKNDVLQTENEKYKRKYGEQLDKWIALLDVIIKMERKNE